jgi:anti-sigma B factor antagonist
MAGVRIHVVGSVPGVVRVLVAGEVEMSATDSLVDVVSTVADLDGVTVVEVDLAGVRLLDAAGVAALLAARTAARARGKRLRVSGAAGMPRRVLEIVGADGVLYAKDGAIPEPPPAPASDPRC